MSNFQLFRLPINQSYRSFPNIRQVSITSGIEFAKLTKALTGTKHELAQRAYEKLPQVRREGVLVENDGNVSNAENATISSSDVNTPSFEELTAGWTSNLNNMQKIMHTDVENYLINS